MTNLEVINKYLYRAYKSHKLNYQLTPEMTYYGRISREEAYASIRTYLKLPQSEQLHYWVTIPMPTTLTSNVINVTLAPLVRKIFGEEFKGFLKHENIYNVFSDLAFSRDTQKWRTEQHYDNINVDNLNDFLDKCIPTYYMYRSWCWARTRILDGSMLNDKWFRRIHEVLLEEFH